MKGYMPRVCPGLGGVELVPAEDALEGLWLGEAVPPGWWQIRTLPAGLAWDPSLDASGSLKIRRSCVPARPGVSTKHHGLSCSLSSLRARGAGGRAPHTHYSSPSLGHSSGHQHPPQKLSELWIPVRRGLHGGQERIEALPPRETNPPQNFPLAPLCIYSGQRPTWRTSADVRCDPRDVLQGESSWQLFPLKMKKTVPLW